MWHKIEQVATGHFIDEEKFKKFINENSTKYGEADGMLSTWHVNQAINDYRAAGNLDNFAGYGIGAAKGSHDLEANGEKRVDVYMTHK